MRFTRTRLSDIVHPVSSSQLTQDPDRVRSFGGYNMGFFGQVAFFGQPAKCEVAHTSFRLAPLKSGMATSIWRQEGTPWHQNQNQLGSHLSSGKSPGYCNLFRRFWWLSPRFFLLLSSCLQSIHLSTQRL